MSTKSCFHILQLNIFCLSYPFLFDLTVITFVLREDHFTVTMKVMMPISALISCIFIVLIVIFMLGLLSKRSLNCFTGTSLAQNIQYIHLFFYNLYNIPQKLGQRSYYCILPVYK
jgi:Na+-driven multidrug efflux pump